jgi:excisionase family DNA binding protein
MTSAHRPEITGGKLGSQAPPVEATDLASLQALFTNWPALMTFKRVEHETGLGRRTIYEKIERDELIAVRVGPHSVRIRSDSVKRLVLARFKPVSIPRLRNQKVAEQA